MTPFGILSFEDEYKTFDFFSLKPYQKKHSISSPRKTMYANYLLKPKNSPVACLYKQVISFDSFFLHPYLSMSFG